MSVTVGKIKLIDSYNFLPMSLATLPKAFDLKVGFCNVFILFS